MCVVFEVYGRKLNDVNVLTRIFTFQQVPGLHDCAKAAHFSSGRSARRAYINTAVMAQIAARTAWVNGLVSASPLTISVLVS